MATLTTTTKVIKNPPPDYREFQNFIKSYSDKKVPLNDNNNEYRNFTLSSSKTSQNSSNSSLNSDSSNKSTGGSTAASYSEFLENNRNKKFAPVRLNPQNTTKSTEPKKLIKTEVYIEVNQEEPINNELSIGTIIIKPNNQQVKNNNPKQNSVRQSIQNFEKPKSQDRTDSTIFSTMPRNGMKKSFHNTLTKNQIINQISRPQNIPVPPSNAQHVNSTTNGSNNIEIKPTQNSSTYPLIAEKPQIFDKSTASVVPMPPPPPPFMQPQLVSNKVSQEVPNKTMVQQGTNNIPPPPPMGLFTQAKKATVQVVPNKVPKAVSNGVVLPQNTQNNGNQNHAAKNIPVTNENGTIDRNNPLVRKMVYGAMLNMYGNCHNRANCYVDSLPKNMVQKGNGIQNIINNIAAQGGLDKLNGRANPKSELEL